MRYAIVIELAGNHYSADVPDLPGCVATGRTIDEVEHEIRAAISFHLTGLRDDGLEVPVPSSRPVPPGWWRAGTTGWGR